MITQRVTKKCKKTKTVNFCTNIMSFNWLNVRLNGKLCYFPCTGLIVIVINIIRGKFYY